ncbi:MAG: response regulator [Chloroflexota bacterium]
MTHAENTAAKAHILYVDDEPNNLFAFKSVFRRSYEVATAADAAEAIALLEKEEFDLVLSDYKMPGMTGVALCEYIMTHFPKLKRMIISGYTHEEDIVLAVENGIIAKSIAKPWNSEVLSNEIASILG